MMQIGVKQGMRLMESSLRELVQKGLVTADEAVHHAENPTEFSRSLVRPAPAEAPAAPAEEDDDG
jgi:Tfp pilus assembly pilus retraction ATPase PilT